ncbi:MAG TPA: hypothetical protein VMD59_11910 [Acidimicrobiales bacterium]|nr:hypothetical protein [Acidimicrobiales bacterium]
MLLGPLDPEGLESNAGRRWVGAIHTLVLDCPGEVRRHRIEARPSWRSRDTSQQIAYGNWLKGRITERVDTSRCTPEEAATAVAGWVGSLLPPTR